MSPCDSGCAAVERWQVMSVGLGGHLHGNRGRLPAGPQSSAAGQNGLHVLLTWASVRTVSGNPEGVVARVCAGI